MKHERATAATVAMLLATALLVASAPGAQAVEETIVLPAHGSLTVTGHGVGSSGMGFSGYGAHRVATATGADAAGILSYYYPGAARTDLGVDPPVAVRLDVAPGLATSISAGPVPGAAVTVVDAASGASSVLAVGARLVATRTGSGLSLASRAGGVDTPLLLGGADVVAGPVTVTGAGGSTWAYDPSGAGTRVPGRVELRANDWAVEPTAHLTREAYLRGLLPRLVDPAWSPQALQAGAVVARSLVARYAPASSPRITQGALLDSSGAQYAGSATSTPAGVVTELETAATEAAVAATPGTVLTYKGAVATVWMNRANGGWIDRDGSAPYAASGLDYWSYWAPGTENDQRWSSTLDVASISAACPDEQQAGSMVLTRSGNGEDGGRVLRATISCTLDEVVVDYPTFGLRSNWWRVLTPAEQLPETHVEAAFSTAEGNAYTVHVVGWAADPDVPAASLGVELTVDGERVATGVADRSRPDVAAARPELGAAHGFELQGPAPSLGEHEVCVRAINLPHGSAGLAQCRDVTVEMAGGPPLANLEVVSAVPGGVRVKGWAFDPDTRDYARVLVTIGTHTYTVVADATRPDVAAALPEVGLNRGFDTVLPASPGSRSVCMTVLNVGIGSNRYLGCHEVAVPDESPQGNVEVARGVPGGVQVTGWAVDPSTSSPIYVWQSVDGVGGPLHAGAFRPDIGAAFPAAGPNHGFSALLPAAPGAHTVCLTAVNTGQGANRSLGCRVVTVPGGPPLGNFEGATGVAGAVFVRGWALDPDTVASPYVLVVVDSVGWYLRAVGPRPDLQRYFPDHGSSHGFAGGVPASPGPHRVCVTAVNLGVGGHTSLGCRTVVVPVG